MTAWPPFPAAPTLRKHKHTHAHTPSCKHKHTLFANTNDPLSKHAVARNQTRPSDPHPGHHACRSQPCATSVPSFQSDTDSVRMVQMQISATALAASNQDGKLPFFVSVPPPHIGLPFFQHCPDTTILCLHRTSFLRPDNWQHSCCVPRVQKRPIPKRCDLERRKKQFPGLSARRGKGPGNS